MVAASVATRWGRDLQKVEMAITTTLKNGINKVLAPFNIAIETRTVERKEQQRLKSLYAGGHFSKEAFAVLPQFLASDPAPILTAVDRFRDITGRFSRPEQSDMYSFHNDYFSSPDAEVAYAMLRGLKSQTLVEVGSGNSTLLFREAIRDGSIETKLVSIDPAPRKSVEATADRIMKCRLEQVSLCEFQSLRENDILFIDSSHEVHIGNDVNRLILEIMPNLQKGVVIHIHDIFLPFEYPREWMIDEFRRWNEQYLVQALLQDSDRFEVLWPGHFLQRTLPNFARHFSPEILGRASSLWLRKRT